MNCSSVVKLGALMSAVLLINGCGGVEPVAEELKKQASYDDVIDATKLPRNWKGESTCRKGSKSKSYAIYGTVKPYSKNSFDLITEIPGMEGTSTLIVDIFGEKIVVMSPNKTKMDGTISSAMTSLTWTSKPRAGDGLYCVTEMEAE